MSVLTPSQVETVLSAVTALRQAAVQKGVPAPVKAQMLAAASRLENAAAGNEDASAALDEAGAYLEFTRRLRVEPRSTVASEKGYWLRVRRGFRENPLIRWNLRLAGVIVVVLVVINAIVWIRDSLLG